MSDTPTQATADTPGQLQDPTTTRTPWRPQHIPGHRHRWFHIRYEASPRDAFALVVLFLAVVGGIIFWQQIVSSDSTQQIVIQGTLTAEETTSTSTADTTQAPATSDANERQMGVDLTATTTESKSVRAFPAFSWAILLFSFFAIVIANQAVMVASIGMLERRRDRYEWEASLEIMSLASRRNDHNINSEIRLPQPPKKPFGVRYDREASCSVRHERKFVCLLVLWDQSVKARPTVRLRWVKAPTLDDAFNTIANAYGWEQVIPGDDPTEDGAAYYSTDFLVLMEPEPSPVRNWFRKQWRSVAVALLAGCAIGYIVK